MWGAQMNRLTRQALTAALLLCVLVLCAVLEGFIKGMACAANAEHFATRTTSDYDVSLNSAGRYVLDRADTTCSVGGRQMARSRLVASHDLEEPNQCMFASLQEPILQERGACSKANRSLFGPEFRRLVRTISVREGVDGIGKCVLDMVERPGAQHQQQVDAYDAFLRKNAILLSRAYKELIAMLADMKAQYERLVTLYNQLMVEYRKEVSWLQQCQADLGVQRRRIAEVQPQLSSCLRNLQACNSEYSRLVEGFANWAPPPPGSMRADAAGGEAEDGGAETGPGFGDQGLPPGARCGRRSTRPSGARSCGSPRCRRETSRRRTSPWKSTTPACRRASPRT